MPTPSTPLPAHPTGTPGPLPAARLGRLARIAVPLVLALVATACAGGAAGGAGTTDAGSEPAAGGDEACTRVEEVDGGSASVPVASPHPNPVGFFPWEGSDDEPVVALEGFDTEEVLPGGPPPDGILPVDDPCVESVAVADTWLEDAESVMVVEVEGDARAYPLRIMTQHEIVNDVVGGEPLVVTYCPLCNSGLAFSRVVDGEAWDFGTSGRLYRSNLVMYDRQTRTLWSQFAGEAVWGQPEVVGTTLDRVATSLVAWSEFRAAFPDGLVLARESVPGRDYGRNPYPGHEGNGSGFLFRGPTDERLDPDSRVLGVGAEVDPAAVPWDRLVEERVVELEVDGEPLVAFWAPGQASALDADTVAAGEDVGQTAVFERTLDGRVLTFSPAPDASARVVDAETGTTWDLFGRAVDGELVGARLAEVPRDDTFWFVWFAFQPDTRIEVR
ncbi:MAG: DUF3179 domain-containing protein [Actinomycetes bacterium]